MPTPFRFKLDKVLEYRRQQEERAMMALAEARMQHRRLSDALDAIIAAREAAEAALAGRADLTTADIWLWQRYRERLALDLERAATQLRAQAEVVAKAQAELIDRARDRKLLDKLKTRQAALHAKAENLAEQKEFDEMSSLRFRHQDISAL